MAITKVPARDFKLEIDTGSGSPVWTPIGGLTGLVPAPKTTQADTTDFDSAGQAEHMVLERSLEFTISGHFLEDADTGARDPGQAAVELLAAAIGLASLGSFRLTTPGGQAVTFRASAEVTSGGGSHNDPATWSAKITRSGPATPVA